MNFKSEREFLISFGLIGILFFILFLMLGFKFSIASFFALHYFWHMSLISPFIESKYKDPKHRYSFLKFLFSFRDLVRSHDKFGDNLFMLAVSRFLGPFLFTCSLFALNKNPYTFLFGILGSVVFELYFLMKMLKNPKIN